ncbi:MAG TPA: F0F1 ATP synthase subunit B [Longimicrobiales bacterium]
MNILGILVQEAEQAQPSIFSLNLGVSFWTVIIFLVLLAVLAKYAFPPILGYANARERRIQEILDAAARDRAESERLLEEQRRHLAAARQDAQQILNDAREAAERVRQELLDKARAEQEEVLARARQDIERERERAIDAMRREAVELSLAAAAKLVGERLDDERDRALVRGYLDDIAARGGVGAA